MTLLASDRTSVAATSRALIPASPLHRQERATGGDGGIPPAGVQRRGPGGGPRRRPAGDPRRGRVAISCPGQGRHGTGTEPPLRGLSHPPPATSEGAETGFVLRLRDVQRWILDGLP